ncbi:MULTISPECIES: hypothetical protein [Candidatus Kuenenia]|uniref:DUF1640 domain-containing protein n=1 Tax=Kuenenia stuttgartiensis TaxID=174633 RepID=A0A2C9CAU4_KUEST|nr:hypothetical protein [Candidatus Kuenenia stuttgartiensis]SOH02810.1 hypothetical protein KSMBR1_0294 [Candidatus Kuenenia stuttgartiensis]
MPITKELENIRKFESVGFTHAQAEILAETIEQSHIDGQKDLKEFINEKLDKLELRIKASHADLLMKIFAIVAGCTSIAVAVSKLL